MTSQSTGTSRPRLSAQTRPESSRKSELRQMRKAGSVPATLFAHGDPQCIQVSGKEIWEHLRRHSAAGMVDVDVAGRAIPALIRDVSRDPITGQVTHLNFQRVDLGETVHAAVPVAFVGEETLVKNRLVLERQITDLDVTCQADHLPETLALDISQYEAGAVIHASDLTLPEGVQLSKDGSTIVARVTTAVVAADLAAEMDAQDAEVARVNAESAAAALEAEQQEEAEEEELAAV